MTRVIPKMPNELTCQELVELVTDYLEDRLSADERLRVETHLALCDGCDVYLEQMRETIRTLGKLKQEDMSPDAEEKLLGVLNEWRKSRATDD